MSIKNQSKNINPLNIKQSTYDLIPKIKELAKTMSQKEVREKLRIHKNTLKKIKDSENIKFRTSYLPFGKQREFIPYAKRYTAEEKSAMYKKRKKEETEEDRIEKRKRDFDYYQNLLKDKIRLKKKRERDRKSAKNRWKNLSEKDWEIKKERDREWRAKEKIKKQHEQRKNIKINVLDNKQ